MQQLKQTYSLACRWKLNYDNLFERQVSVVPHEGWVVVFHAGHVVILVEQ